MFVVDYAAELVTVMAASAHVVVIAVVDAIEAVEIVALIELAAGAAGAVETMRMALLVECGNQVTLL